MMKYLILSKIDNLKMRIYWMMDDKIKMIKMLIKNIIQLM